jgi:hypothetical protein
MVGLERRKNGLYILSVNSLLTFLFLFVVQCLTPSLFLSVEESVSADSTPAM